MHPLLTPPCLPALQAGAVTADSISPPGSLKVTTSEGSVLKGRAGEVVIESVHLREPATCAKSPGYAFHEEGHELGAHRCRSGCGCRGQRVCLETGWCRDPPAEPATCVKGPAYAFPEETHELGAHRCRSGCGCRGQRVCELGVCRDPAPVREPVTCTKGPAYAFDEEIHELGAHRCRSACGCRGERVCSPSREDGWCRDPEPVREPATCAKGPAYAFPEERHETGAHRCHSSCGCRGQRVCMLPVQGGAGWCGAPPAGVKSASGSRAPQQPLPRP